MTFGEPATYFRMMTRGLASAVLVIVLVTCSAAAASPKPVRSVLVYAKADSPRNLMSSEHIWRAQIDGRHSTLVGVGEDPAVSPVAGSHSAAAARFASFRRRAGRP